MKKRSMFVGMDVHQDSVDLTVAEGGHDGVVAHFASIGGDLAALDGAVATLRKRGAQLHFIYEAGPCGYGIYRHLRQAGLDCAVVAPAQVPKRAADRIKTDRRDSRTLALQHRAGTLRAIYVPDEDDEAMRDLVRAREDAVHTRRRARQRINSFLLRHGRPYPCGKKNWGARHRRWLAEQSFERVAQRITLEEYLGAADECDARVTRLTEQIGALLAAWHWRPVVEALQTLRGVSLIVAVTVVAEVGDLTRFTPRALMAFLGLVPAEYSSGARRCQGGITKTGNAHVRRVLAEAAHAYRATPALTPFVRQRQQHLPQSIRAVGWKAQLRLCGRFRHLTAARKHPHKVRMAIARELTGFMLDIARRVATPAAAPPDTIVLRRRARPTTAPGSGRPAPPAPPLGLRTEDGAALFPTEEDLTHPNHSAHHRPCRGGLVTAGESSMALRAADPRILMLEPSVRQPHDGIETGGTQPADISRVQSSCATRPSRRGQ